MASIIESKFSLPRFPFLSAARGFCQATGVNVLGPLSYASAHASSNECCIIWVPPLSPTCLLNPVPLQSCLSSPRSFQPTFTEHLLSWPMLAAENKATAKQTCPCPTVWLIFLLSFNSPQTILAFKAFYKWIPHSPSFPHPDQAVNANKSLNIHSSYPSMWLSLGIIPFPFFPSDPLLLMAH